MKMISPFRICFLVAVLVLFMLGIKDFLYNSEENACNMTWMYYQIQFIPVTLSALMTQRHPNYHLYLYAEGYNFERWGNLQMDGVPVLFIPGNAGSYKQVRSLASVSYLKSDDPYHRVEFNYFAADFNEELSGASGEFLKLETDFVKHCIVKILNLYKKSKRPPQSVILVGHSMGGMVARAVLVDPDFKKSQVQVIITEATPHQSPVLSLDVQMVEFYDKVNRYWSEKNATDLKHITVISTGGGFRDVIVRSALTSLNGIVSNQNSISTLTMSMPSCWLSTDHLSHVWCHEVVMATCRSLFGIIDPVSKQVAFNSVLRRKIFGHHFLENKLSKQYIHSFPQRIELDSGIKWEVRKKKSWTFEKELLEKDRYSTVELHSLHSQSFVIVSNIENHRWIGGCKLGVGQTKCKALENLASLTTTIPPKSAARKLVHLSSKTLSMHSHLVVILPSKQQKIQVAAELFMESTRNVVYQIPDLASLFHGNSTNSAFSGGIALNNTEAGAIFYNVSFPGLIHMLQAYSASLTLNECHNTSVSQISTVAQLSVPWDAYNTYFSASFGENAEISLLLQSSRPPDSLGCVCLLLYLNPMCTYKLQIQTAWTALLGQMVRLYWPLLPALLVVQLLVGFSRQLSSLDGDSYCLSFCVSHLMWGQPWRVAGVSLLIRLLLYFPRSQSLATKLGLPMDDTYILEKQGMWALPVLILLYLLAYSLIQPIAFFITLLFRLLGTVTFPLQNRMMKMGRIAVLLQHVAGISGVLISIFMNGWFGLCISTLVLLADCIRSHWQWRRLTARNVPEEVSSTRFHLSITIFLLSFSLLLLQSGALLVFLAKGMQYSLDTSRYVGIMQSLALCLMRFSSFPTEVPVDILSVASHVCYFSSVFLVLFGIVSIYRIPYCVSTIFLLLALSVSIIDVCRWFNLGKLLPEPKSPTVQLQTANSLSSENISKFPQSDNMPLQNLKCAKGLGDSKKCLIKGDGDQ